MVARWGLRRPRKEKLEKQEEEAEEEEKREKTQENKGPDAIVRGAAGKGSQRQRSAPRA